MKKLTLLVATTLLTGQAFAAETYIRNGQIYTHEGRWVAEAGAVIGSKLYKGQDHTVAPLLNFGYHGEDLNVDFGGINYRFLGQTGDTVNVSAYLGSSALGYKSDDADILKSMDKRDISLDLGLNVDFAVSPQGTISTYFQHDVTNAYGGYLAGVKYFHVMNLGKLDLVPFAGVTYQSSDYVDYYFGVKDKEANSTRKAYKGGSDFAYNLGYKMILPLSTNWEVTQTTTYARLGSDISDSPLVDSANQWLFGATVAYHF
ncbi:outer membrane protein OmpV [Vibrio aestuarianus]|uniref:MipA/OmpV family protein n=1 Tax=Vibrio aestuarianus TaxID=28171 RepID=A0A9X4FF02_9VIBR|nr:MipA/OmpV family protein [Vibrio aestuarianus]MDE1235380.1 MipA/OmpV family protein [Vibrio aestuarianus]MDE1246258.1 MipA/OmpV family protein [Vibrio aestuarianus]MDE1346926.1 MipA/OmpV family protein [Vibrio aestuarianus]NGZ63346.1 MipA/OmpV family protein [Vibrio aestuarianus subsp. cardii]NGZ68652.1 MipA/OmpV family protein [Vibrio aestuarianus subsp. cardii]